MFLGITTHAGKHHIVQRIGTAHADRGNMINRVFSFPKRLATVLATKIKGFSHGQDLLSTEVVDALDYLRCLVVALPLTSSMSCGILRIDKGFISGIAFFATIWMRLAIFGLIGKTFVMVFQAGVFDCLTYLLGLLFAKLRIFPTLTQSASGRVSIIRILVSPKGFNRFYHLTFGTRFLFRNILWHVDARGIIRSQLVTIRRGIGDTIGILAGTTMRLLAKLSTFFLRKLIQGFRQTALCADFFLRDGIHRRFLLTKDYVVCTRQGNVACTWLPVG